MALPVLAGVAGWMLAGRELGHRSPATRVIGQAAPVYGSDNSAVHGGGAQRDRTSGDVHTAPPSGQFDQWVFGGCVGV